MQIIELLVLNLEHIRIQTKKHWIKITIEQFYLL